MDQTMDAVYRACADAPGTRRDGDRSGLFRAARAFAEVAGLAPPDEGPVTGIIESGHQPNYLPYPGIWRKAHLIDRIRQASAQQGIPVCAVWGFADQNLSTAAVLFRNLVPSLKKSGSESIGFPRPEGERRLQRFSSLAKPPREAWEREREKLARLYPDTAIVGEVLTIMDDAYERAASFADFNAISFARICTDILGISLLFVRYSDLEAEGVGSAVSQAICSGSARYTEVYNRHAHMRGLPPVAPDHVPFWLHCPCGGKVALSVAGPGTCAGRCPICGAETRMPCPENGRALGFTSVTRDVVMGDALGSGVFVSGAGGSLVYGGISRAMADAFSLHRPLTLAWSCRDAYLGPVHLAALRDCTRFAGLDAAALLRGEGRACLDAIAAGRKDAGARGAAGEDGRAIKRLMNEYAQRERVITALQGVFTATPSIIDLFAAVPPAAIRSAWDRALGTAIRETNEDGVLILRSTACYPPPPEAGIACPELADLYDAIRQLGSEG